MSYHRPPILPSPKLKDDKSSRCESGLANFSEPGRPHRLHGVRSRSGQPFTERQQSRCPIFTRVADFCRKVFTREPESGEQQDDSIQDVIIVPRAQHNISRQDISDNALKVLYRLNKAGYEAYLVGGGVRDLLLNKSQKISTLPLMPPQSRSASCFATAA